MYFPLSIIISLLNNWSNILSEISDPSNVMDFLLNRTLHMVILYETLHDFIHFIYML